MSTIPDGLVQKGSPMSTIIDGLAQKNVYKIRLRKKLDIFFKHQHNEHNSFL